MALSRDVSQTDSSGQGDWVSRSRGQEGVQFLGNLSLPQSAPHVAQEADASHIFDSMTAWFSSSVDSHTKQLWKDHGGIETDFDRAQFIFSADNSSPDTLSVFNSTAYIMEHLAVFHSQFISDAAREWNGNGSQVVLGHYVLPPQDILNDVRKHVKLCWDVADQQNQPSRSNSKQVIVRSPPRPQNTPSRSVANNSPGRSQARRSGESSPPRSRTEPTPEEGVVHIRQLRKVRAGAVTDFVPMKDGAEVYHKAVR